MKNKAYNLKTKGAIELPFSEAVGVYPNGTIYGYSESSPDNKFEDLVCHCLIKYSLDTKKTEKSPIYRTTCDYTVTLRDDNGDVWLKSFVSEEERENNYSLVKIFTTDSRAAFLRWSEVVVNGYYYYSYKVGESIYPARLNLKSSKIEYCEMATDPNEIYVNPQYWGGAGEKK